MISGARQNRDWMYVQILSSEKQDDPKSIILMPDFSGLFNRIFSGLRSQWIMSCSLRYFKACKIWMANLLIKESEKPQKLLLLMNSYKLIEKSSNEIIKCCLNMICALIQIMLHLSSGSLSCRCCKIFNSTPAWCQNFFLFLIILIAVISPVKWSITFKA